VYSPPAVAGELVFVGSCAGKFLALDRHSGGIRWEYDIHADGEQTSFHGAPLLSDDLVLTTTDNGFRRAGIGHVYAFERATGHVRWKHRCETGIPSDVVAAGANVCVVTMNDDVVCLDREAGEIRWSFGTGVKQPDVRDVMALATLGGRVFFAGRDNTLYALAAGSGEVCWKTSLGEPLTSSPLALHGSIYVGTARPCMYKLDSTSGEVQATLPLPATPRSVPACAGEAILVFLGDAALAALDADLTRVMWSHTTSGQWHQSRPLLINDLVMAGDSEGQLMVFALRDGLPRWVHAFEGEEIRSLSEGGHTLYVGTLRGTLYAWQPAPGQPGGQSCESEPASTPSEGQP
jgi:outer membrane protein assembly factor BamB